MSTVNANDYARWYMSVDPAPTRRVPTPERVEAERQQREASAERRVAEAAASSRAKDLFVSFLSSSQRAEFANREHITVTGRSGARYRIRKGTSGNVAVLRGETEQVMNHLCFHPADYYSLPVYDVMLAQLLHLQDDDVSIRRVANVHP